MPATSTLGSGRDALYIREPLVALSLWGICMATVAVLLLSAAAGFWLGRYQGRHSEIMQKVPMAEIVGAMFGLLAFMLGFTFSLAATRFDARRALVVDEANAIGTTYLRAGLLPEPYRAEIRKLLREYVKQRLMFAQSGEIAQGIAQAEEMQGRLWAEAVTAGEKNPGSIVTGLFISSLNEVIDLHAKRIAFGLRNHIPTSIWAALYFLAICTMGMMGCHMGLAGARRLLAIIPLVLTFSVVMFLIADLDRPQKGLLRVSQQALTDLLDKLNAEGAESRLPRVCNVLVQNDDTETYQRNNQYQFTSRANGDQNKCAEKIAARHLSRSFRANTRHCFCGGSRTNYNLYESRPWKQRPWKF
ncbi:MAG: hypothetical protein JWQ71_1657 [Pedosphaera sp.]|nr:hypothetical protein [Pedosphaera sp.]